MLRPFFLLLSTALFLCFTACNTFQKTEGGLEYKIIKDKDGANAQIGDVILLEMKYANAKDTFDTHKHGSPLNALIDSALVKPGTVEEGLLLLSSGDSAVFKVENKVLYEVSFKEPLPKELKANDKTTFYIKVDTIYKRRKIIQEQIDIVNKYKEKVLDSVEVQKKILEEEPEITQYLKSKGLNFSKTQNGVYVAIQDTGSGKIIKTGNTVVLDYAGKLLNDSTFQDTRELNKPFTYVSGAGQAVLGWDEGLEGLSSGTKVVIVIPSPLAYGSQGIPGLVPPHRPVAFEVDIQQVKNQ